MNQETEEVIRHAIHLPLQNCFSDRIIVDELKKAEKLFKKIVVIDAQLQDCAQIISERIAEMCPGFLLDPDDAQCFQRPFKSANNEVIVHAIEFDGAGDVEPFQVLSCQSFSNSLCSSS